MTQKGYECKKAIREALKEYHKTKQYASQRVDTIREQYGDEAAARELEAQTKRLADARDTAETIIRANHRVAVEHTEKWGRLDGSQLTDDVKLLDAGLVDPAEFDRMKSKYSVNNTMLVALKKYGDRQNDQARKAATDKGDIPLSDPFNVKDIPTPAERVQNWDKLQTKAMDTLDAIDGKGKYSDPWTKAFGTGVYEAGMDTFGDDLML